MLNTRIILSATWVVATLIYLYGDVLRIYHGGDMAKALADMKLNQFVWLGIAFLMLTPILMVFLTLPQLKSSTIISIFNGQCKPICLLFLLSVWLDCVKD